MDVIRKTYTSPGLLNRVRSEALFSSCMRYRYALRRTWWEHKPHVAYLMLNPSTANERINDPTVERCEQRARLLGCGGYYVLNLFALRSTDPAGLRLVEDPIGPLNNAILERLLSKPSVTQVICAWGTGGGYLNRAGNVLLMLDQAGLGGKLRALKLTKDGHPQHPLYLSPSLLPFHWSKPYASAD